MDTAIERVREKIANLEARLADLRIAERELLSLEPAPAAKRGPAGRSQSSAQPQSRRASPQRKGRTGGAQQERKTIVEAITEVLLANGPEPVAEIAKSLKRAGRKITNRSVSFALQQLKKRGTAAKEGSEWRLVEGVSANAQS